MPGPSWEDFADDQVSFFAEGTTVRVSSGTKEGLLLTPVEVPAVFPEMTFEEKHLSGAEVKVQIALKALGPMPLDGRSWIELAPFDADPPNLYKYRPADSIGVTSPEGSLGASQALRTGFLHQGA